MLPPDDLFEDEGEPPAPEVPARSEKQLAAARSISEWAKPAAKRAAAPKRPPGKKQIERARAEALRRGESGEWDGATGAHLLEMYAWLHEQVYGVPADELTGNVWLIAARDAGLFLKREFAGDAGKCVSFMRWAWKREEAREAWRRENGKEGGRIGWRLQFSRQLLTDYKLDRARRS